MKMFPSMATTLALALIAPPAVAQSRPASPAARPSEAAAHFDRGTTFYGEGDYSAALVEYKRAYEASPTWQVLFNIGQCYFQLRDYANALVTLQRFASEGGDRITRDDRATLDTELPDLANRVAKVAITSNVAGAVVSVDDQVIGTTPLREPALVSAGSRRITATYEGRAPVQQRISVGGGDVSSLRLDFAPPAAKPAARDTGAQPSSPNHAPAFVSFAAAGAGLAVGTVFGVMAMSDKSSLDKACTSGGACPASSQRDIDALSRNGLISTVGFGVGAAGAAVGLVLWLAAGTSSEQPSPRPRELSSSPLSVRFGPGFATGTF